MAHVPEDRMEDGLIADFTVADNLVLNSYWRAPFASGPAAQRGRHRRGTPTRLVDEFDVRTPSIFNAVGNLSGGNQQKVIAAREFSRPLKLIVAAQPTRGLDVGSIEYIHGRIVAEARRGRGRAHRLERARRGARPRRSDRRDVPGQDRRHPRSVARRPSSGSACSWAERIPRKVTPDGGSRDGQPRPRAEDRTDD